MPVTTLRTMYTVAVLCLLSVVTTSVYGQQHRREVVGVLSGAANSYGGEFTSDLWGAGGFVSLQYAPLRRLSLEGRFGLGEIRWKVTEADLIKYPEYFGQGAVIGDLYPGTSLQIEPENESRVTTVDFLLNYVLVPDLPAVPFLTLGIGLINFSPSTNQQHEALPNNANQLYSRSAFSIPVGGGVRIPFNEEAGLILRAEHRFSFTTYLDDFNATGSNDNINTISIGLTYTFNPPHRDVVDESDVVRLELYEDEYDDDVLCEESCDDEWCDDEWCGDECCDDECCDDEQCCDDCCCCCCDDEKEAASAPAAAAEPPPAEPPSPPAPDPGPPSPPAEPAVRKAFSKDIRFKLDTDEFDFTQPETQKNLEELLTYMKEAPSGHEVIIEGHASSEGPPQRNKVLSDLRAKKIRQWLVEQGVEPEKIRGTVGYGSSMPKVIEPSPAEAKRMTKDEIENIRRQNRRIEVHVLKDAYLD